MAELNPLDLFTRWFEQAKQTDIDKPNAMCLATVNADGQPSARIVLLSRYDQHGFVFHTNYLSRKGEQIKHNAKVSLVFWWDPLGYQVRIEGRAEFTSPQASDAYFSARPRGSQIGAWASPQSTAIGGREDLEEAVNDYQKKFADQEVPRPPHWGGYCVVPETMEFWINRDDRLHHRELYSRVSHDAWELTILAP